MKGKMFLIGFFVSIFVIFQVSRCEAGAAVDLVHALLEEVMSIQTDPKLKGQDFRNTRRKAVNTVIARHFYFDSMAKEALNLYWEERSREEREEFKAVFQDLLPSAFTPFALSVLSVVPLLI